MSDALAQALSEYRAAHPEDDDLPDEAVGNLLMVRQRALGIAVSDFGRSLAAAFSEAWRRHW